MDKKEALFYTTLEDNNVKCNLCPHNCMISEGNIGNCRVRKNDGGNLYSLVYGKPCSINIDPVEKKPLYHFLPGKNIFSIGTVGCNLHCKNCQNSDISQESDPDLFSKSLSPKEVVDYAKKNSIPMIAYTYNEPTVFFEYMLDIAKLAKNAGIKNVMVSNGFINEEPLYELCKYMDAANIDIKCFSNEFYKKICFGSFDPVLKATKQMHLAGVWVELTNLIIPTLSDDMEKIEQMCRWIKENLSTDVPLHFSRFFPQYQLENISQTSTVTLENARDIAIKYLNHVYIGNTTKESNTYCLKCKKLLIARKGYHAEFNDFVEGKCVCGMKISGVWG